MPLLNVCREGAAARGGGGLGTPLSAGAWRRLVAVGDRKVPEPEAPSAEIIASLGKCFITQSWVQNMEKRDFWEVRTFIGNAFAFWWQ